MNRFQPEEHVPVPNVNTNFGFQPSLCFFLFPSQSPWGNDRQTDRRTDGRKHGHHHHHHQSDEINVV